MKVVDRCKWISNKEKGSEIRKHVGEIKPHVTRFVERKLFLEKDPSMVYTRGYMIITRKDSGGRGLASELGIT